MAKARSRFNQHLALAEAPNKGHVQRLTESERANTLLQEALAKSGELVASLEAKVELLQKEVADVRKWWRQDQDTVGELRERLAAVKREPELMASLSHQRDTLQRQLDKCLGWIARAQDKGPYGASDDDPAFPFNNGSR